ncbi:fasciclin domain-containing protein [Nocardioides sp. R-C-SC26]|uniref:fasciclin domain-containing protein n=1 Tax=Nocardioides sp. R-C-SC26 TaxID=2870414 RepID=UPI001E2F4899|nr:fasciclin domain-containing protein [Nocardioides sp. R-C-SC26]
MNLHSIRRRGVAAAAVLALSVSLAACGGEDDEPTTNGTDNSSESSDTGMGDNETDAGADVFGDACSEVPADGAGSFNGMVQDPVATAASNNPLLSNLVAAVGAIDGLADTLNTSEALTVFAPYNPAFEEIPADMLNDLVKEAGEKGQDSTLFKILGHHVLAENDQVDDVAGDKDTLVGDSLTIEGDENGMTVSDGTVTANVLCGNIPTANATVYVIDKVLTGVK